MISAPSFVYDATLDNRAGLVPYERISASPTDTWSPSMGAWRSLLRPHGRSPWHPVGGTVLVRRCGVGNAINIILDQRDSYRDSNWSTKAEPSSQIIISRMPYVDVP